MSTHVMKNRSFVVANFKNGIKRKKLGILLLLVNVFGIPYALVTMGFFSGDTISELALPGFAMAINMILGMVIPFLQFDYCYDKVKVDQAYSLPLTRRQKFCSDFFAGLSLYVGAYVIQIILATVVAAIFLKVKPEAYYINRLFKHNLERIGDIYLWYRLAKVLLIVLVVQILLYTVTSLVISCTGAMFEAITTTIAINILIPSTIYIVYLLCANKLYGMTLEKAFVSIALRTSPLGGFLYLSIYGSRYAKLSMWLISMILVTILLFVLTLFLMTRRKAEEVGKPYVVPALYHIILVAVMLHIGVLACYTKNNIPNFLFMTAIFYLVIEVITNRGLKKIKKSILRYVAVSAITLGIILTINKTNCFGVAYYVAAPENTEKIVMSYSGFNSQHHLIEAEMTSRENIKAILEFQKEMIDSYKERTSKSNGAFLELMDTDEDKRVTSNSVQLTVVEKDKTYSRDYRLTYQETKKLLGIEFSEEYIDASINEYIEYATFLRIQDTYGRNEKILVDGTRYKDSVILQEFYVALSKDLKTIGVEEYLRPQEQIQYRAVTNRGYINILSSYSNTIAVLKKYDALPSLTDEDYANMVSGDNLQIRIGFLDENKEREKEIQEYGYYTTMAYYGGNEEHSYVINTYGEQVKELLKVAQVQYAAEEECYKLDVYGDSYLIPPKYSDLAADVIKNYCIELEEYYQ